MTVTVNKYSGAFSFLHEWLSYVFDLLPYLNFEKQTHQQSGRLDVTTSTFLCIFSSRFSGNLIYGPRPITEHDFGPAASKGCRPVV